MICKFFLLLGAILLSIAFLPDTKPLFGFDVDLSQRSKLPDLPSTFSGPLLANNLLSSANKLFYNELWGAESFAVWDGRLYTGLGDGRIVQILPDALETISVIDPLGFGTEHCAKMYNSAHCGRALGLKFDSKGMLYTVAPSFGLYSINVTTGENRLIKSKEELGSAVFLDDLVVYEKANGHIVFYITELSHRWALQDSLATFVEQEQTGRLLSYDTESGIVNVELDSLAAPNGVELTDDREAILLASVGHRLIYKYSISGENSGKLEVLIENLPGEPDNIHRSTNRDRETYWVALFTGRNSHNHHAIDKLASKNAFLLRFLMRLQRSIGFLIESLAVFLQNEFLMELGFGLHGMHFSSPFECTDGLVLEIDGQSGEIVNSLHSPDGSVCAISEVVELEQTQSERHFYFGSPFNSYLGKLSVAKSAFRDSVKIAKLNNLENLYYSPAQQIQKTNLVQDDKNQKEEEEEDNCQIECPSQEASFVSLLTYRWIDPLIRKGYQSTLTLEDIWKLNEEDSSGTVGPKFFKVDGEVGEFGTVGSIVRCFGWLFLSGSAYRLGYNLLQFVGPQLLKVFIDFISCQSESVWPGYLYAFTFFSVTCLHAVLMNLHYQTMSQVGMKVRAALMSAIYRKSVNLSNSARREATTGEMVNLMSVDAERLTAIFSNINNVWAAPLTIGLTLYFLWCELGPSVLAGLAVLLCMMPLNGWIASHERHYQIVQMQQKDERVKLISEALNGIRVIKLYGWEVPFIERIGSIRAGEIRQIGMIATVQAVRSFVWTCAPILVTFVTLSVYVMSSDDENVLDPKKAFVSLALFELLRNPLVALPEVVSSVVMASVAVGRLNRFLNSEQLQKCVTRNDDAKNCAITIQGGIFSWGNSHVSPTLNGIDLNLRKGQLVAIVGHVGSGKSSLLSAILGDMEWQSGTVNVAKSETVAYVAQQAWIQNATLRENVLFGLPYVKHRFDSVIEMCALTPDLAILPGGDQTEIGEKGINLSGGQKQRVALARACYSNASLVLLDDPLSAVDSHVSRHIFGQVLSSESGYLRERTRILVTNQITFLPEVDQIVVLENGTISKVGNYEQLMTARGKFADFVQEHSNENVQEDLTEVEIINDEDQQKKRKHQLNAKSSVSVKNKESQRNLTQIESTESGNVKLSVYMNYLRAFTWFWLVLMLVGFVAMQTASMATNWCLAVWSNGPKNVDNFVYLKVYGFLGLAQGVAYLLGATALAKGAVNSSTVLHSALLGRVMRAPMSFFDTTPIERIVNRFSKDVDTVDANIPSSVDKLIVNLLQVVATIVLIFINMPLFMAVILPIVLLYYFIHKHYIPTSRQLKRLEAVTRSPIFSHFGETLSGPSTIRAYGAVSQFIEQFNRRVDTNLSCFYLEFITNRWLELRLKFVGNLVVLSASTLAVLSRESFREQTGFIGLVIVYSLSVTQSLAITVRRMSEMEANAISVERIREYCEIASEREWVRKENASSMVDDAWPEKGKIEFVKYSMRYRPGLDLVLKGIDVVIGAGEKIGIVGRTGAGKSSLTLALFRIVDGAEGKIVIDGVDISKIGLHELRNKLTIIPQDPILFSGTLRSNLDPFNKHPDNLLCQALEHSNLKSFVRSLESGLDYQIAENGSNLSVGQRQLICLGRALLRTTQILVLDEATAATDLEADALIQATIRNDFSHCTVLTIAHRLNTIMDSTRVLVMDHGRVAEFDAPAILLANHRSLFHGLAKNARII